MATMIKEKPTKKKKQRNKSDEKKRISDDNKDNELSEFLSSEQFASISTAADQIRGINCEIGIDMVNKNEEIESCSEMEGQKEQMQSNLITPVVIESHQRDVLEDMEKNVEQARAVTPTAPEMPILCVNPPIVKPTASTADYARHLEENKKILNSVKIDIKSLVAFDVVIPKYHCPEIAKAKELEKIFLASANEDNFVSDPLYKLLCDFFELRIKVRGTTEYLCSLKETCSRLEPDSWSMVPQTITYKGECADGNKVVGGETYHIAQLNEVVLQSLDENLEKIRQTLYYSQHIDMARSAIIKFKVDETLKLVLGFPGLHNRPYTSEESACFKKMIRQCLSILFIFLRKTPPDKEFNDSIRGWLQQLIFAMLKIASWEDNLYLLFHILRCPCNISKWAAAYVQLSFPSPDKVMRFSDKDLHNCVSFVSILLDPVEKRNEFLKGIARNHKESSKDASWTLLDSDGEETSSSGEQAMCLKEHDMIAFLNQIPFENYFCYILNIKKESNELIVPAKYLTTHQLLKIIGLSSVLITCFGKGLMTYNTDRHRQFTKRLGRLIAHNVSYVNDFFEIFCANTSHNYRDVCTVSKAFDDFFVEACGTLYACKNTGTWQYFSSLPFRQLSSEALWKLFYFFNTGFQTLQSCEDFPLACQSDDFQKDFNMSISEVKADDLHFLLQTFVNMALIKSFGEDQNFVKVITTHIYKIGFVNSITKDLCYKMCRDMLVIITTEYPDMFYEVLMLAKNSEDGIENGIYLFKAFSLKTWKPSNDLFQVLSFWLTNFTYDNKENNFARIIISRLNWEFDENNELFLPHDIHVITAIIISQSLNKYKPESIGQAGVSENMQKISDFVENASPKKQFTFWCWKMCSILKLHMMDQCDNNKCKILCNLGSHINKLKEVEQIDGLVKGVAEQRPISLYLSLMISLWGHSIPLVCQKGFSQMQLLLNDHRYSSVIQSLYFITPLFLESPESLSECKSFQSVLIQLLNADCTYFNIAKSFLTTNSIGPVLEMLSNMIQSQLINYRHYGLEAPTRFVLLWLSCLTQMDVFENQRSLYLIDLVLKISHTIPECWFSCKNYLRNFYKNERKVYKPSMWKIFSTDHQSMNPIPVPSQYLVWFSLLNLELDHEIHEVETGFWHELLLQLQNAGKKVNMDLMVKKASQTTGGIRSNASGLVVYKYAEIINAVDLENPLLPILCQQFYSLYLARVPLDEDTTRYQHFFGVSDKFYEYNLSLMKKLKKKFSKAEEYYAQNVMKSNWKEDEQTFLYATKCSSIFRSFNLWLEETELSKFCNPDDIRLPSEYNSEALRRLMFCNNEHHWMEHMNILLLKESQEKSSENWLKSCYRWKEIKNVSNANLKQNQSDSDPVLRIKRRLKSYDAPIKPAPVIFEKSVLRGLTVDNVNDDLLRLMEKNFKLLQSSANQFNLYVRETNSLDKNYIDLIKTLYTNTAFDKNVWLQCELKSSCKQPAEIYVVIKKPNKSDYIEKNIQHNRSRCDSLKEQVSRQNNQTLATTIEKLAHTARCLVSMKSQHGKDREASDKIQNFAIKLLYKIIDSMTEEVICYPIASDAFFMTLSELRIFIEESQDSVGINVLKIAFSRPKLVKIFSELIIPTRISPPYFLSMYNFLVDAHMKEHDSNTVFVLLSKFDVQAWLKNFHPKLYEISQIIRLIISAIENWNRPNVASIQGIFRKHLVHVFEYNFPEHYGEVLQMTLISCAEQKLDPIVYMDLLNSLLSSCDCGHLDLKSPPSKIDEELLKFAKNQKIFDFKSIADTLMLLAKHFQSERLQYGLHGLYPKYKAYCQPLSILFSCFSQASLLSAVYTFTGALAEKICDCVFHPIVELYSPWIIIYDKQNMRQDTANWIKQLVSNEKLLLPWSQSCSETAEIMVLTFIKSLLLILETLPVSAVILNYVFSWYEHNFVKHGVPKHILKPIHTNLLLLPWAKYQPSPNNIESMCRILKEILPECHSFVGSIFVQTDWNHYFQYIFTMWNADAQIQIIGQLFEVFVKIAFEPYVHDNSSVSFMYERAADYPWHIVSYHHLETVLNWFVQTVEPIVVLKLPSESNKIETAVLDLVKIASQMTTGRQFTSNASSTLVEIQGKRILYVRSILRLLKGCSIKHRKLLSTQAGLKAFNDALIDMIKTGKISSLASHKNDTDMDVEVRNMLLEIIRSVQKQDAYTSSLFVNGLILYQSKYKTETVVISNILNVIADCKKFLECDYLLLETTLYNYFNQKGSEEFEFKPSWKDALKRLGNSLASMDIIKMIEGQHFLSVHLLIIYCKANSNNVGENIAFLQKLLQNLESAKISWSSSAEVKVALVWSSIISICYGNLEHPETIKDFLLHIVQYMYTISERSETWSQTLLGAIGLRKDSVSLIYKVFLKCMCALVLSQLSSYNGMEDVELMKEFTKCLKELQSLEINRQYADLKQKLIDAISIVENLQANKSCNFAESVWKILSLFYNETYFESLREIWSYLINTSVT